MIEISQETYEKLKTQFGSEIKIKQLNELSDMVGEKYFIRTVTYHLLGKIEKIIGNFFVLSGASWVADSGRFMNAIKDGKLDEVEPVGTAMVNIDTIVDCFPWTHKLPTEQK